MVKSLKFLRHRRTDAGYFSEFLIAKTPGDLENREPRLPQQQQLVLTQASSSATVFFAPAVLAATHLVQPNLHGGYASLPHPATVAMREEVVLAAPAAPSPPPPSGPAVWAPAPPRSKDPLRLARRRERNRAAAAKCRQRRQDRLELLADCVRELESANGDLEAEVAELAAARAQLEAALRQHVPQCDGTAAAAAAATVLADDDETAATESAASVWLTQPLMSPTPMTAARPMSLSLTSAAGSSSEPDELPSLLTPRGCGLTPLLMTPQSAFKLEAMLF